MAATKAKIAIKPLEDRVVVKRTEAETTSAGGIYIPDGSKEKPQQGQVIAVGPGKKWDSGARATPDVKGGDVILFGKYGGTEITVDGEEVMILRESDILAKVN